MKSPLRYSLVCAVSLFPVFSTPIEAQTLEESMQAARSASQQFRQDQEDKKPIVIKKVCGNGFLDETFLLVADKAQADTVRAVVAMFFANKNFPPTYSIDEYLATGMAKGYGANSSNPLTNWNFDNGPVKKDEARALLVKDLGKHVAVLYRFIHTGTADPKTGMPTSMACPTE